MSGECQICKEHSLDCLCGHLDESIDEYVNHPNHYQGNSIEVIDVIEDFNLGFNLGNAIKYILRSDKKGGKQQDLNKAIWYLEREIMNGQEQLSSQDD